MGVVGSRKSLNGREEHTSHFGWFFELEIKVREEGERRAAMELG